MILKQPSIIDIYEGEYPVNIAGANALLTICRASIQFTGTRIRREDYRVMDYVAQCKAAGLKYGLYHFLTPNGIAEQAALFLNVWNKAGGASVAVVDIEVDLVKDYGGTIGNQVWQNHIKYFLDLVGAGTGKTPIIYTNLNYWNNFVRTRNSLLQLVPPAWTADYPLWVAQYFNEPDLYSEPKPLPAGWTKWAMWQYFDKGRSNGFLANDLNVPSVEFQFELGDTPASPEYYIVEKQLTDVTIEFTGGTGELPLDDAVSHATSHGWLAAMNAGAGFEYTHHFDPNNPNPTDLEYDKTHAIPKTTGFQAVNGIPYANRLITDGVVNSALDNTYLAPWSVLAFRDTRAAFIVTRGREGEYGKTKKQTADWLKGLGYTNAYLFDSGHSCQIEENGTMLYWPYGPTEKVPQFIGFKAKTTGITKTHDIDVMSDGSLIIDGKPY